MKFQACSYKGIVVAALVICSARGRSYGVASIDDNVQILLSSQSPLWLDKLATHFTYVALHLFCSTLGNPLEKSIDFFWIKVHYP